MTTTDARRAPDLSSECPLPLSPSTFADVSRALRARHEHRVPAGEQLELAGHTGQNAAVVVAVVSEGRRHREVLVFARGEGGGLDGPLGAVVDVLDDVLGKVIGVDRPALPLDWQGRPWAGGAVVFVRGELRDYAAEEAAAVLLGETPPPRAIPQALND